MYVMAHCPQALTITNMREAEALLSEKWRRTGCSRFRHPGDIPPIATTVTNSIKNKRTVVIQDDLEYQFFASYDITRSTVTIKPGTTFVSTNGYVDPLYISEYCNGILA